MKRITITSLKVVLVLVAGLSAFMLFTVILADGNNRDKSVNWDKGLESLEMANYLDETCDIIAEETDALRELDVLLMKIPIGMVDSNSVVVQLNNIEATYQDLLTEFKIIHTPEQCIKFSDYFIDYLSSAKTSIKDLHECFRFGYESDLDSAIDKYISTDSLRSLAYHEWDRLYGKLYGDDENDVIFPWY